MFAPLLFLSPGKKEQSSTRTTFIIKSIEPKDVSNRDTGEVPIRHSQLSW